MVDMGIYSVKNEPIIHVLSCRIADILFIGYVTEVQETQGVSLTKRCVCTQKSDFKSAVITESLVPKVGKCVITFSDNKEVSVDTYDLGRPD